MFQIFCKISGKRIPLVSTGTSPFLGAGQFGMKAHKWRRRFLNNPDAMIEILEASYRAGARGIEAIPTGKILEASRIMAETHSDYIITGSTYPGSDPGIEALIEVGAKLIFVHGMISDDRGNKLLSLLDDINSRDVIPGIATHDPIPTLKYIFENNLNVKAFLIPFNSNGSFMGDKLRLEELVDKTINYSFIGMKTLSAGTIEPKRAFNYIAKHNICAVTIGMVTKEEAKESTMIALDVLNK